MWPEESGERGAFIREMRIMARDDALFREECQRDDATSTEQNINQRRLAMSTSRFIQTNVPNNTQVLFPSALRKY